MYQEGKELFEAYEEQMKHMKNKCYEMVGEAFIRLDNRYLDLSQQTIGWYKLYKIFAEKAESSPK